MAALAATLLSYKTVPTRKQFQMVLEMPIEKAGEAIRLFGKPDNDGATWLAIARLDVSKIGPEPAEDASQTSPNRATPEVRDGVRRSWTDYKPSQQCAIKLKEDQDFRDWLVKTFGIPGDAYPDVELLLKSQLGISSKTELDDDPLKGEAWNRLLTSYDVRGLVR